MALLQYREHHKRKKIMIGSFSGRFPPFLAKKGLKLKIRQKRSKKSEQNHKKFLQTDNFTKKKNWSQTGNFCAIFRLKTGITNPALLVFQFWYWTCFVSCFVSKQHQRYQDQQLSTVL